MIYLIKLMSLKAASELIIFLSKSVHFLCSDLFLVLWSRVSDLCQPESAGLHNPCASAFVKVLLQRLNELLPQKQKTVHLVVAQSSGGPAVVTTTLIMDLLISALLSMGHRVSSSFE